MKILGIETSCDETAAAIVRNGVEVLSNEVYSQVAQHEPYGGVVPELASRCHVEVLPGVVGRALAAAGQAWPGVDAIAVTYGPGLASSLLIGVAAAKSLALRLNKPLRGVNHLEAHLYSVFLGEHAPDPHVVCPLLVLLVTGGHTCLVLVREPGVYQLLGRTLDDAAGEALDKGASLLGLRYPGGPAIEVAAGEGNPVAIAFPRGLRQGNASQQVHGMRRDLCFSFSGLKTSLLYHLKKHPDAIANGGLPDLAASYQEAVFQALLDRTRRALEHTGAAHVACVGGVARNQRLGRLLGELSRAMGVQIHQTQPGYCTDNAAMIAALAGSGWPHASIDLMMEDIDPNLAIRSA